MKSYSKGLLRYRESEEEGGGTLTVAGQLENRAGQNEHRTGFTAASSGFDTMIIIMKETS